MANQQQKNGNESTQLATQRAQDKVDMTKLAIPVGDDIAASELANYTLEHVVSLQEGKGLKGIYRGPGPELEFTDPQTGEVRPIKTWRLELSADVVADIQGSMGLDKKMAACVVGRRYLIVRGPQINTRRGFRVNQYIVAEAKGQGPRPVTTTVEASTAE